MKRSVYASCAYLLALAFSISFASAKSRVYEVDLARSFLGFEVSHLGFIRVPGRYHDYAGEVDWEDGAAAPTRIDLEIRVASVDTRLKWRDDILRGPEFFDVANTPVVHFASRSVRVLSNGFFEVTGGLTIRDITLPLTFPLASSKIPQADGAPPRRKVKGEFLVVRLPYGVGVRYAPPFIGELVTIKLDGELVARRE
jgi:polyisoprenoid-binding protein YceI